MTVPELRDYGMVRMGDDDIRGFLSSQSVGVLALPTEGAPFMRPLSFWFDGSSSLYFVYVLGPGSRKEAVSERADVARFLVYRSETAFNWRSVLLAGSIDEVPEGKRDAVRDEMEIRWRPDLFERASESENTALYRLQIEEQAGVEHVGLPPGFEESQSSDDSPRDS